MNDPRERFHKPDRSDYTPNLRKSEENEQLDFGWTEGFMSDGRPYRAEAWALEGLTSVTFFFSTAGLETLSKAACADLLEREGLIKFTGEKRYLIHIPREDASGRSMWAASVLVAAEEEEFAEDYLRLHPYASQQPEARLLRERLHHLETEEDYRRHGLKPMVFIPYRPVPPPDSKEGG